MNSKTDDKLDPKAKGKQTSKRYFDRNREGVYGGLPKVRQQSEKQPDVDHEKSDIGSS